MNDIELLRRDDGTIRLLYWDAEHCREKTFVLCEDGHAFLSQYDGDTEVFVAVNLVVALRKLAT